MIRTAAELKGQVEESRDYIRKTTDWQPEIGIILGTGLGALADEIETELTISYREIPNFPTSTVESHDGKLIFGTLSGKKVVAMRGRFHLYEGYSPQQITFPIRVMKQLGINILLVSNAGGTVNHNFRKGHIMIIEDHINLPGLTGQNPLIGINDDSFGPRFTDMSEPWSKRLIEIAEDIALELKLKVYKGTYLAVTGPNLETRAEYRFIKAIGADIVGMSTVHENLVARQMGLEVLGLSVITDECYPDALEKVALEDILEAAGEAEPQLTKIMKEVAKRV